MTFRIASLLYAIVMLFLAGCAEDSPAPVTVELPVTGMTCGTCENAIKSQLEKQEGVLTVAARHVDETVSVEFYPELIDDETIISNIEILGFDVVGRGITPGSEESESLDGEPAGPVGEE